MPGPRCYLGFAALLALAGPLLTPTAALAYVGPGPGLEFVPTFFSLLTWAGVAMGAVLWWPVSGLIHRIRGSRGQSEKLVQDVAGQARSGGESR